MRPIEGGTSMHRVVIGLSAAALLLLIVWDLSGAYDLSRCYAGPPSVGYNWCEFVTLDLLRIVQAVPIAAGVVAVVAAAQAQHRTWVAALLALLLFSVVELGGLATAIGCSIAAQACGFPPSYRPDVVHALSLTDGLLQLLLPLTALVYGSIMVRGQAIAGEGMEGLEGLEVSSIDDEASS